VRATAVLDEHRGLQTSSLVGQVRSTAVDLLRGSGLSEEEAIEALDEATRAARAARERGQPSGADSR
jgi:hypothetical protein